MSDKEIGYQHICAGDFIIHGMDGFAGAMGISDSDGKASPVLMVFRSIGSHDLRFINYLLRLYAQRKVFLALTTSIRVRSCDLNWAKVAPLPLTLPSFGEQQAIADYLDAKTAEIDALVADCEREVVLLREYRKAVISEAVTRGLNPDAPMKDSGVEWIGEIPEGWEVERLKYLLTGSLQYGATEMGEEYAEYLPRYIRITDIAEDGSLRSEEKKSLACDLAAPFILEDGDLLFARSGATVGKAFLYRKEMGLAAFAGYLIRGSVNRGKVRSEYLYYWTQSGSYENWKLSVFNQATIQNIGADKYKELPILCPNLIIQDAIITNLDAKTAEIDSLIEMKQQMAEKLREYRRSLISEAVTGKFKVPSLAGAGREAG